MLNSNLDSQMICHMPNNSFQNQMQSTDALRNVFENTVFVVREPTAFTLRVGEICEHLASNYKRMGAQSGVFLTLPIDGSEQDAQQRMLKELRFRSLHFSEGVARDAQNEKVENPGYFVWGLSLESSKTMARKYGQPVLVWCDITGLVKLIPV